jgi:type II secretory pathway component GspD/PulD (secretin)
VKLILTCMVIFSISVANAVDKISMNFNNEELTKIIEIYSKASGQKFIIDPSVRGKISILLQDPVTLDEAFNYLSSALAVNGFAISKQGDTMVIRAARNIQRDYIEVSAEKPTMKPERMYTWIYNVKNVPATSIFNNLRILTSKDGEIAVNVNTNQIVFTDWASNLNRVSDILKEIDKKIDPSTAKLVEISKKEYEALRKERLAQKNERVIRREEKIEKTVN